MKRLHIGRRQRDRLVRLTTRFLHDPDFEASTNKLVTLSKNNDIDLSDIEDILFLTGYILRGYDPYRKKGIR
jgi:hypothetical protein